MDPSSGILSQKDIKEYRLIVSEGDSEIPDSQYKTSSFDLSLGDRHFVSDKEGKWKGCCLDLAKTEPTNNLLSFEFAPALVIPPFGSAIVELKEPVDTLSVFVNKGLLIVGRFDLKLKAVYKGLISQQATQVEPCYYGKLFCFLHNFSSQEAVFQRGKTMATIEFSYAGKVSEATQCEILAQTIHDTANKYNGQYIYKFKDIFSQRTTSIPCLSNFHDFQQGCGIKDVRWFWEQGRLPKDCGLTPIYHKLGEQFSGEVSRYLERSDTVEKISSLVNTKLEGQQTTLKAIIGIIAVIVSFFGINYMIEVETEMKYLSEELAFIKSHALQDVSQKALNALHAHTEEIANHRVFIFATAVGFLLAIAFFAFIIALVHRRKARKTKTEKWREKRDAFELKRDYKVKRSSWKKAKKASKNRDKQK